MEPESALEICRNAVKAAERLGADQAEVIGVSVREARVNLEASDVGTAVAHDEDRFGLRVRVGGSSGFSSTNDPSRDALEEAARAAIALARVTPADPDDVLPEPRPIQAVAGLRDEALEQLEIDAIGKLAGELAARTRVLDERARVDSGWVSGSSSVVAIATSTGIEVAERATGGDAVRFGMAVDGDRVGSFDVEQVDVCTLEELTRGLDELAPRFVSKVVATLDAGKGETFKGTLLLSREAVAEFLLPMLSASLSARAVRTGRSRFADRLHERVCSEAFGVCDDGTLPGRPGSASFDREGLPHRSLPLIEAGVLRSFLFNSREARAARRESGSTGHASGGSTEPPGLGPTNLIVAAGGLSEEALIGEVEHGILLSRFAGNTDPVSGDFSGVAKGSRLLQRGATPRVIQETLVSGNIYELLEAVSGVGREREWIDGTVLTPMIRLEGISVTAG